MVNLLAEDSSLGVRAAAERVAAKMKGIPSSHAERLRKKFRQLQATGQLPRPISRADQIEQKVRELYRRQKAEVEDATAALPLAIQEAEDLGLEVRGKVAAHLVRELERRKEFLDEMTLDTGYAYSVLTQGGITDEERAASELRKLIQEREQIDRHIEAVRRIRNLGATAGFYLDWKIS